MVSRVPPDHARRGRLTVGAGDTLLVDGAAPARLDLRELADLIWPAPLPEVPLTAFRDAMLQIAIHLDQAADAVSAMNCEAALPRPLRLAFDLAANAEDDFSNALALLDAPSPADRPTAAQLRDLADQTMRAEVGLVAELAAARTALIAAEFGDAPIAAAPGVS